MPRLALLVGAGAVLVMALLAIAAARDEARPGRDEGEVASLRAQVAALSRRLDEEAARREMLEETVSGMVSDFVVSARPEVAAAPPASEPGPDLAPEADPHAASGRPGPRAGGPGWRPGPDPGVDVEALVEAGFARRDAERYAALVDDAELRQLELRDRAAREGWLGSGRYREESRALRAEIEGARARYGDAFADWALYTSGGPNRLRVDDVIEGSAAAEAGLEPGDVVEHYADTRVLSFRELRRLTTAGRAGASTAMDVRRGKERVRVYVPRGPLGVRLQPVREEPDPAR